MRIDPGSMSPDQITKAMASLDSDIDANLADCHRLIEALPSARLVPAARAFLAAWDNQLIDDADDAAFGDDARMQITVTMGDIRRLRRALAE